jgi:rhodanese-related sulfurtransferase
MGLFSFFRNDNKNVLNALQNGAYIIDVRSPHEYDKGKLPTRKHSTGKDSCTSRSPG